MTISSEVNRSGPYNGNGVTTIFDYDFKIYDENHLRVIKLSGGAESVLEINADYIVSGVGNPVGGQIATTAAPLTGETITVIPNVPFTQETDLENQGAYYAETVERALDLATIRDQQLQEQIDRAVTIPASADASELAALIEDVLRISDSADEIDTVAGIAADVTTVAGIAADVSTVAGISGDVPIVAGVAGSVVAVAANTENINAVAGIEAEIIAVPGQVAAAEDAKGAAEDAKDAAEAARDEALGAVPNTFVLTRTALKALDTTAKASAYLTEQGREGQFLWRSGNYSAEVAADTAEGKYVKANAIAATAGVWARASDGRINVREFGAAGDGIAINTAAIQAAIDVGNLRSRPVYIPGGTFLSGPLVLRDKTMLTGDGPVQTTLKAASGTTGTFVSCEDSSTNDLLIERISFDGNWFIGNPNGVDGTTLNLRGARPVVKHITIMNAAGTALHTQNTPSDRKYSILGHFDHITIDKAKTHGWRMEGPNDNYLAHIEIVDVSQGTDLTGYGYWASGDSYSRAFNMHIWNRTTGSVVPRPIAGVLLQNGGNIFSGCHFESGERCVVIGIGANYNFITDSSFYAPDGTVAVLLGGSYCRITGMVGGNKDLFYPNYAGVFLGIDAANKVFGNVIDVMDSGCSQGAVNFTNSGGSNRVRVRGWKVAGELSYVGPPHAKDDVDVRTDGTAPVVFRQIPT